MGLAINKKIIVAFLLSLSVVVGNFTFVHKTHSATDIKNDATLSTNLVSCWEFSETSGTRADSYGSNDLTAVNSPTRVEPNVTNINYGVDLDYTNPDYLYITDGSQTGLDITTANISMSAWIKVGTLRGNTTFASKVNEGGNNIQYMWRYGTAVGGGTTGLNYLWGNASGAYGGQVYVTKTLSTVAYQHVVITADTSGNVKFYVDGSQVGTTQTGGPSSLPNRGAQFEIGTYGGGAAASAFDGVIAQACIWDRTLDTDDISALYNSGAGIPFDAGGGGGGTVYIDRPKLIWW